MDKIIEDEIYSLKS